MVVRRYRYPFFVVALLALAAVVAACGGGGNQSSQPSQQQPSATAPATPSPGAPPESTATAPPTTEQPSGPAGTTEGSAEGAIVVVATDEGGRFRFEPDRIEVRAGQQVTLRVVNRGPSPHDLTIESLNVETGQFGVGEERTLTFTAPAQPGEYEFICNVPGHVQLGMKGTLVVR